MEPATEPAKLLLVDDDEDILMMLRMGLQRKGFEVHSETNPVKALETIPQLQPKLVMVDLSMPEMHGVEFLKQ